MPVFKDLTPIELSSFYCWLKQQDSRDSKSTDRQERLRPLFELSDFSSPDLVIAAIDREIPEIFSPEVFATEDLQRRVNEFKEYIKGRWVASGESDETKKKLIKSLVNFFLNCENIEPDVLLAQFPPHKDDYNCFQGIIERFDAIQSSENLLIRYMQQKHISAQATAFEYFRLSIALGNQTHANEYLAQILGLKPREAIAFAEFETPSSKIQQAAAYYSEDFYERLRSEKDFATDLLSEFYQKLPAKLKEARFLEDLKQGNSVIIKSSDTADFFEFKKEFDAELLKFLETKKIKPKESEGGEDFSILNQQQFETLDKESDDSAYIFAIQQDAIYKIAIQNPFELELQKFQEANSRINFNEPRKFAPLTWQDHYQSENNLSQRLESESPKEMLEALNLVYFLSKPGYGSCVFYAFREDLQVAMANLQRKFQAEPLQQFYQQHQFKITEYLERLERFKRFAPENPRELERSQRLFIFANLHTKDAIIFAQSLTPEMAKEMLLNQYSQEFGKTISCFTRFDLLNSLVARSDSEEIFPAVFRKAEALLNENEKAELLLTLLISPTKFHNSAFIEKKLEEIDLSQLTAGFFDRYHGELIKFLINTKKISSDHILLKFIPKLNLLATTIHQENLLMIACRYGHIEATEKIIDALKNNPEGLLGILQQQDGAGFNALMIACYHGHTEVAGKIIDTFKDNPEGLLGILQQKTTRNDNALMLACYHGHTEIAGKIIDAFKDNPEGLLGILQQKTTLNDNALMLACDKGHIEVVEKIIDALKDNQEALFGILLQQNGRRLNALMLACDKGSAKLAGKIIDALKDNPEGLLKILQEKNHLSDNSLTLACNNGNTEVVGKIIDALTNNPEGLLGILQQQNYYNDNALTLACDKGHIEVAERIIDVLRNNPKGLLEILQQQNNDEFNILMIACDKGHNKIAEKIIKAVQEISLNQESLQANLESIGYFEIIKKHPEIKNVISPNSSTKTGDAKSFVNSNPKSISQ